ncbi:hypothetical protein SAMN04488128_1062 [Chitinophaga eiseniae]|uniref:Uncharacterized protein n=1 Tax=Chitinophaga eiseniae TaxID=634771 RepID=A0A1T4TQG5_9BACT|nr:hypothetical protein [Chitinophaga eiseniae]SKA42700.1 hypothetical protein SAMN04488128_1062 [Chitinophaga eiseniae]
MKKVLFLLLAAGTQLTAAAQIIKMPKLEFDTILSKTKDSLIKGINNSIGKNGKPIHRLVSEYTFRRQLQNDFSTLLTGDKSKTTVGQYAAVDFNESEQIVAVTPYALIHQKDPLKGPFKSIFQVDASASTSGNKIFDFKNRFKATLGVSATLLHFAGYRFEPQGSTAPVRKPDSTIYAQLYTNLADDFKQKFRTLATTVDSIDFKDIAESETTVKKAYIEKVADYETTLTKKVWTSKLLVWSKWSVNFLSFDNLNVIADSDTASYKSPIEKNIYNPSLQGSGSGYWIFSNGWEFYGSLWAKIGIKHTLSEIFTTSEWKKIKPLRDSAIIIDDSKDVYQIKNADIKTKLRPDFGGQFIVFHKISKKSKLGLDLSYTMASFLSSTEDNTPWSNAFAVGLIIGLQDKEGNTTVNIEPYYQRKHYLNFDKESRDLGGVKFSIPFTSLMN